MNYIIGVDFDNTIVCYDNLLHSIALDRGLINASIKKSKRYIRDEIRQLEDGDKKWQELQAVVYGQRIREATIINGVARFFKLCKKNKVKVYIISHKTLYAGYDSTRTNLRASAIDWMERNNFFKDDGLSMSKKDVNFQSTRQGKIKLIKELGCTHFIDDLEETFIEISFPKDVEKILYSPHCKHFHIKGVKVFRTWRDINEYLFKSKE